MLIHNQGSIRHLFIVAYRPLSFPEVWGDYTEVKSPIPLEKAGWGIYYYLTNNDVNFIQIFGVIKILPYICIQNNLNVNQMVKHLYIIAGCNGAGKTTASKTILPKSLLVKEFVNADEIAKGLSPFNPEGVAIEAGRLMLRRIEDLLEMGESFSIETTLATRSYINLVRRAQEKGYVVHLLFFWLDSIELAKRRVADRVASGGHNIPLPVIERRYKAGLKNLFEIFMKEVDIWILFDNSLNKGERVAFGGRLLPTKIKDIVKFKIIKDYE